MRERRIKVEGGDGHCDGCNWDETDCEPVVLVICEGSITGPKALSLCAGCFYALRVKLERFPWTRARRGAGAQALDDEGKGGR